MPQKTKSRASVAWRLEVPDVDVVSCHAFTQDEELLVMCPNTEDILLYRLEGEEFRRIHTLSKHTQRVTGLAWSGSRRFASCSEDRTALVWECDGDDPAGDWRKTLVELKAPRAALCVSWAPNGARFAVGLASKDTAVCYFNDVVSCWVALKVGRSKAAVTALAWHPTSQYLATGSTDRRCMVYDVNEQSMLPKPEAPFGDTQMCDDAGSWVNAVAFSPAGRFLAFAAQDSTVRFKELAGGPDAPVDVVRWKRSPFVQICFLTERILVACGFDCVPVLLRRGENSSWEISGSLDTGAGITAQPGGMGASTRSSFAEARSKFGARSSLPDAQASGGSSSSARTWEQQMSSGSCHTNTITSCKALGGCGRFSTSGSDGLVIVWAMTMET